MSNANTVDDARLPELPVPHKRADYSFGHRISPELFTAEQMHEYARAALTAALQTPRSEGVGDASGIDDVVTLLEDLTTDRTALLRFSDETNARIRAALSSLLGHLSGLESLRAAKPEPAGGKGGEDDFDDGAETDQLLWERDRG